MSHCGDCTQLILTGLLNGKSKRRNSEVLAQALGISLQECLKRYGIEGQLYLKDDNIGVIPNKSRCYEEIPNQPFIRSLCGIPRLVWVYSPTEQAICWDGLEKNYYYVEWIEYLIRYVVAPRGYVLNGEVETFNDADNGFGDDSDFDGDEEDAKEDDIHGSIIIENNVVTATHPVWRG